MDGTTQGMQSLLSMAAQDSTLRELLVHDREALLQDREGTLGRRGVILTESERTVLLAIPADRLQQMIDHVDLAHPTRRRILVRGQAACGGIRPDCTADRIPRDQ